MQRLHEDESTSIWDTRPPNILPSDWDFLNNLRSRAGIAEYVRDVEIPHIESQIQELTSFLDSAKVFLAVLAGSQDLKSLTPGMIVQLHGLQNHFLRDGQPVAVEPDNIGITSDEKGMGEMPSDYGTRPPSVR